MYIYPLFLLVNCGMFFGDLNLPSLYTAFKSEIIVLDYVQLEAAFKQSST